jgi:3-hydroxybutyryl-CoA dehydrogenase
MSQNKIAVIGAGIMGQGVSYQLSKYNYDVVLIDISEEKLDEAVIGIRNIQRLDILMQKQGKSKPSVRTDSIAGIQYTTNLSCIQEADIIIENISEKRGEKESLYQSMHPYIQANTLIAINSSATPITRLASILPYPRNVLGIHFVNPVHLMPTVEMVKGFYTDPIVIERAKHFLGSMNMDSVLVNDAPGFVSNRIMLCYINEAVFCLQEGISSAHDIDKIFKECLAHTMGPLETADLIGVDTILYSLEVLYHEFNDSKYRPAYKLKEMVAAGLLGRKSGSGFYNYEVN